MQDSKNLARERVPGVGLPRRDWLAVAAAALLSVPAFGAAKDELKAKAKKNLKMAVHTGPYAALGVDDAARRIRAQGFAGVLTDYAFADARFDPLAPDWKTAEKIVGTFERQGIRIVGIFGYVNVVDPVAARRKRGEARMETLVKNWKRLGCSNVSTETGTFNPKSDWEEAPENATEQGYLQCRAALEKLARMAEKAGAVVSIEPYWRNIIDSIDRTERLFREVQSPGLKLVMDPCNYFRKEDLSRMGPMLKEMFARLGPQIVLAHAKDVKASAEGTDLPASGLGVLDYPLYLRLLAGLDREMDLVVEHVALDDVARAREYVLGQLDKV